MAQMQRPVERQQACWLESSWDSSQSRQHVTISPATVKPQRAAPEARLQVPYHPLFGARAAEGSRTARAEDAACSARLSQAALSEGASSNQQVGRAAAASPPATASAPQAANQSSLRRELANLRSILTGQQTTELTEACQKLLTKAEAHLRQTSEKPGCTVEQLQAEYKLFESEYKELAASVGPQAYVPLYEFCAGPYAALHKAVQERRELSRHTLLKTEVLELQQQVQAQQQTILEQQQQASPEQQQVQQLLQQVASQERQIQQQKARIAQLEMDVQLQTQRADQLVTKLAEAKGKTVHADAWTDMQKLQLRLLLSVLVQPVVRDATSSWQSAVDMAKELEGIQTFEQSVHLLEQLLSSNTSGSADKLQHAATAITTSISVVIDNIIKGSAFAASMATASAADLPPGAPGPNAFGRHVEPSPDAALRAIMYVRELLQVKIRAGQQSGLASDPPADASAMLDPTKILQDLYNTLESWGEVITCFVTLRDCLCCAQGSSPVCRRCGPASMDIDNTGCSRCMLLEQNIKETAAKQKQLLAAVQDQMDLLTRS